MFKPKMFRCGNWTGADYGHTIYKFMDDGRVCICTFDYLPIPDGCGGTRPPATVEEAHRNRVPVSTSFARYGGGLIPTEAVLRVAAAVGRFMLDAGLVPPVTVRRALATPG